MGEEQLRVRFFVRDLLDLELIQKIVRARVILRVFLFGEIGVGLWFLRLTTELVEHVFLVLHLILDDAFLQKLGLFAV